jgi:hypothetical protein
MKALKLLLLLIPLLVISCGNDDDPEIFSSGFWEDSYLQYHVKNKVKTIKEWDEGSTSLIIWNSTTRVVSLKNWVTIHQEII